MRAVLCAGLLLLASSALGERVRRQAGGDAASQEVVKEICLGKGPNEYFRLNAGQEDCGKIFQCTDAGLQAIKCPLGLHFDLVDNSCNWKTAVHNCDLKERPKLVKPLLFTEEPVCTVSDELACADMTCIKAELFCNGEPDCSDGTDENACGPNEDPNRALPCDPEKCKLPNCFCSEDGTTIPDNLPAEQVPQMIMITFNGAINNKNIDIFNELFNTERVNPNGCPIKGTFFVSHRYTNYTAVQDMHNRGHEIAVFSISQNDTRDFWKNASTQTWTKEMGGQRFIIEKFAGITDNSVVGMRTPYLRVGGNRQFGMMDKQKFLYDSTITAPLSDIPIWPYTLLNRMPHPCHGNAQSCPTRGFPVWEMVMNELDRREDPTIDDNLPGCAQVDSCSNIRTGEQFYNFLNTNFDRHYNTNRAPLALNFHSAYLEEPSENLDYLLYWIDEILSTFPDVYFVTMTQVIEWIQKPLTSADTQSFDAWRTKCEAPGDFFCSKPGGNDCTLQSDEVIGTFNMQTCQRCPSNFPWLNDPLGEGFQ